MISFKSKVTQKILNYFFINPSKSHYINELAGILDLDPKNTHRKLEELANAGILKCEFRGQQRYFFLDNKSPIIKEYRTIFLKTFGWQDSLAHELSNIDGLRHAYIFGSAASGKMDNMSDIDLLLVGSHSVLAVAKIISRLQKNIGREINTIQMSSQEFAAKRRSRNDFIANVLRNKNIKLL